MVSYSISRLIYRISLDISQSFFSFQNNPKDLDLSYKTDLDICYCKGRVEPLIIAKFHRTDLVICSHSIEEKSCLISKYIGYS